MLAVRLVHNCQSINPHGLADHAAGYATVALDSVLAALRKETQ